MTRMKCMAAAPPLLAPMLLAPALLAPALLASALLASGAAAQDADGPWTERDAVAAAVARSPSARAAVADWEAADAAVRVAAGARAPTLSITGEGGHSESLAGTGAGSIVRQSQDSVSLSSSARVQTDIGAQIDLGLSSGITWRSANLNPASTMINTIGPIYSTTLSVDLRQPLFRGAGDDATLGPARQAHASARAAELSARQTVSTLVRDALVAYRELAYARQALAVRERSLALAQQQHEEARAREELGSGSHVDTLRYASARATAQSELRAAQAEVETAALALGTLLGLSASETSALQITEGDAREESVAPVAMLTERAVQASPELASLSAQVDAARALERTRADADQIQLDLVGQLMAGLVFNGSTIDTFALPDGRPAFTGIIGLELTMPLGPGEGRAAHEQALAQLAAAEARYDERERQIASEIATQRSSWASARERSSLAEEARASAQALADTERAGLTLGTVTSVEVVQAQQDERSAALTALRASADRRLAEIRLAHLTGTLLDAYDVEVDTDLTEGER